MPKPKPNESRDDFLSRCIPIVLEEGTAESRDQAVAICSSMYDEKSVDDLEHEIEEVLEKKKYVSEFVKTGEIDEEKRTVTAIISSDVVDRDREVLVPRGVKLENFEKNPVVLWMHDHTIPPIGKAEIVKVGLKKIIAKVKFAQTEFADQIFELFKQGFLRAFSVGFQALKSHEPSPDEIRKRPEWAEARRIFDEWELFEFSAVSVPANPTALTALSLAVKNKTITLCDELQKTLELPDVEPEIQIKEIPIRLKPQIKLKPLIVLTDPEKEKRRQLKLAAYKYRGKMWMPKDQ